ncbi:MAG: SixA phosphatase family protein, partial [Chitinophagales bacterium]
STARILCDELGFDMHKVVIEPGFYFKEVDDIIEVLHKREARPERIFIIGHNPTFTNLANALVPGFTEMIPTCGIVSVRLNIESWGLLKIGNGIIDFFEFPKKYR